jgi:hypothetical protein
MDRICSSQTSWNATGKDAGDFVQGAERVQMSRILPWAGATARSGAAFLLRRLRFDRPKDNLTNKSRAGDSPGVRGKKSVDGFSH